MFVARVPIGPSTYQRLSAYVDPPSVYDQGPQWITPFVEGTPPRYYTRLGDLGDPITDVMSSSWAPYVLLGGAGFLVWALFFRRRRGGGSSDTDRARRVGRLARAAAAASD
jgi:hypothetical protein